MASSSTNSRKSSSASSVSGSLESVKIPEGSDYKKFGGQRSKSVSSMEEPISPSSQGMWSAKYPDKHNF